MASLFRHFSFDSPPQQPSLAAMDVSPTSTVSTPLPTRLPTPPPSCSVAELTETLDHQSLRLMVDSAFTACREPLTPPSDNDSFAAKLPSTAPSLSTTRINSATLRMQRQANVRMQCSSSHVKDITAMVERMVEAEDQCNICDPKSPAPPASPTLDEDEGVDVDFTPADSTDELRSILPTYRAHERTHDSARVSKNPRMRRRARLFKIVSR